MENISLNIEDLSNVGCLYFEVPEFNRLTGSQDNLILLQQNLGSFNANFDTLSCFQDYLPQKVDILVLTENWFREGLRCNIEGYKAFHTFRSKKSCRWKIYFHMEKCSLSSKS